MLARQINTVFVLIAADHARIWMSFLTDQSHLYLAYVGLIGSNLENSFIFYFEQFAGLALHGESLPRTVGRAHVFNVVLSIAVANGRVDIA